MAITKKRIGLGNYQFGNKNNWRRWLWNRIIEKMDNPCDLMLSFKATGRIKCETKINRREAVCLYLPGPKDIDREIATSKGIKNNNLIACDTDDEIIKNIRKNGNLGINGDIADIIYNFGNSLKINVLAIDLCCGLTEYIHKLLHSLIYMDMGYDYIILGINMMRGRDRYATNFTNINDKHRGKAMFEIFEKMYMGAGPRDENHRLFLEDTEDNIIKLCLMRDSVSYYSYRSKSGTIFDSIVFIFIKGNVSNNERKYGEINIKETNDILDKIERYRKNNDIERYKKYLKKGKGRLNGVEYHLSDIKLKRQIAWVKAQRTIIENKRGKYVQ